MYYGVDYYPEHWPQERWSRDIQLMKEASINVVRLAEFAWAVMEPEAGKYDFAWLDQAVNMFHEAGIQVILGTPTATPPKWLVERYPDIYMQDRYGQVRGFGSRRHYCYNSPEYRRLSEEIIEVMAKRYGNHPGVMGWQTDNEFGCHDTTRCFCPNCQTAFRRWLERKYGNIDALNKAWGTVFWSQTYNDWNQVIVPAYTVVDTQAPDAFNHNPGLLLDFYRFSSDSAVEYQDVQLDALRRHSSKPITHNYMGHFSQIDYFDLGRDLDFVSWDNYPSNKWGTNTYQSVGMAHALMRGIKQQNYWVMEQQSGPCGWNTMGNTPQPGQLRLWAYQAMAHGGDGVVYFRWRACLFGTEQYWYGVLDHDGIPRRRYGEIRQTGQEFAEHAELFLGADVPAETAIIKSYDSLWSHQFQPHTPGFDYNALLYDYYRPLADQHIPTHVTGLDSDLTSYKLVIVPALNVMNDAMKAKLTDYVEQGGTLVVTFRSGTRHEDNSMTEETLPGYFRDLAGIDVVEFDVVKDGRRTPVKGLFGAGTAKKWCDIIENRTAETAAVYEGSYYKGSPAVTVNKVGQGQVFYVGCDLDETGMDALMAFVARRAGVKPLLATPIPGVEAVGRVASDGTPFTILLNHNDHDVLIPVDEDYRDVLSGHDVDEELQLKPFAVAALQRKE